MGTFNLSALTNVLKDGWMPMVKNDINMKAKIYQHFRKSDAPFEAGNNWYVRFQTGYNESFGWTSDGGNLPAKGTPTFNRFTIVPKYAYSQFEITGPAMSRGSASRNAMKDALMTIKEDTTNSVVKHMNQAMYGDGTGWLGEITATNGSTTLTMDNSGALYFKGFLDRYLMPNHVLAVHDATNSWAVLGTCTISSIARSTNVVTVDTVPGSTADGDRVALALQGSNQSSYNLALIGLEAHVDDGTNAATYQGLTRSNVPRANANVISNSGTNRPLTLALLEQAYMTRVVVSDAMESDPMLILCDTFARQKYIELLQGQVRYVPMVLKGGTKKEALAYNDRPIDVDCDCTYNTWYFLTPDDFQYHVLEDWKFEDRDGSILKLTGGSTNTHVFYAMLFSYMNLSCTRPRAQTKLSDITQTIITPV